MLYSLAPMKGVPFLVRQYQGLWICLCDRSQDKVNKTETIKMKITTDCAWLSHSICCLQSPHREKPRLCWFQQISYRSILGRFCKFFHSVQNNNQPIPNHIKYKCYDIGECFSHFKKLFINFLVAKCQVF